MSSGIAFLAPLDAMPAIDSDSKLQAVKAHDRGFAALLTQELSAVTARIMPIAPYKILPWVKRVTHIL